MSILNHKYLLMVLVLISWINSAYAYECVLDTDGDGIGDGTAGASSFSRDPSYLACGANSRANGLYATAVGAGSKANGISTAIGYGAEVDNGDVAIGHRADAKGYRSIAIGTFSEAVADGAIAIGHLVRATTRNTMKVEVPIHIKTDSSNGQILVHESNFQDTSIQTLMNLVCTYCTPAFRFHQILPSNNTWYFRMLQNGDFSVDDPATITKEAEFRSGGDLKIGGTLIQASSREIKTNFTELNGDEILKKIDQLPITRWSYKKDDGKINHIGPMAEDFYTLFGVGLNNKGLSSVDTAGVALAAIKSLHLVNKRLKQEKDIQITDLKRQNTELSKRMQTMEAKFTEIDELKRQLSAVITNDGVQGTQLVSK